MTADTIAYTGPEVDAAIGQATTRRADSRRQRQHRLGSFQANRTEEGFSMHAFLLGLLFKMAQLILVPYVRGGFFQRVEQLVLFAMDSEHSGADKRQKVQAWLSDEYGEVAEIVQNLAIELAVARFVLPQKR